MIVGVPAIFAIESGITQAYANPSLRALGFFAIPVGGRRFGVCAPDATMLANSFDAVAKRAADRGTHTAPFSGESDARRIADAVLESIYADDIRDGNYFGFSRSAFSELVYSADLVWAPDGDEAFDDRSCVLQFDVNDRVRLIGFTRSADLSCYPTTLRGVWMPADDYYRVLQQWRDDFQSVWAASPKLSASKAGENRSEIGK